MPMPNVTLWTFDGPPESESDLPSPPPSGHPATMPVVKKPEEDGSESDEEEFHDAPITQDNPLWNWNRDSDKELPKPPSTPPATPPAAASQFITRRILNGHHHNATFEGTSQYAGGGSSACGLASMNAIRLAFDYYAKLSNSEELVSKLISEDFVKEAMAIAASWPDQMHLEVEPILQLPLFSTALQMLDVCYGEPRFRTFSDAIIALKSDEGPPGPRAAILTRPPEMIAVMHIPLAQQPTSNLFVTMSRPQVESIYLIFDSHPRLDHPNGAAIQVFPSRPTDNVADYLTDLFQVDESLLNDPSLEWHVQLLGQVSYHVLAPVANRETLNEYELNMRFLTLAQQASESQRNSEAAQTERRKLQSKCFDLEQEIALLKHKERMKDDEIRRLKSQAGSTPTQRSNGFTPWCRGSDSANRDVKGKGRSQAYDRPASSKPGGSGTSHFKFSSAGKAPERSQTLSDSPRSSASRTTTTSFNRTGTAGPSSSKATNLEAEDPDTMRSLQLARDMQREFDEERYQFSLDESLARAVERPRFDCGICMESFTDEAIALVDGCNHSCCRDCMRSNIQSKIEERRYPIPCPFCVAGSDEAGRSGATIPAWLVETIGVSAELFNIFTEMQLAEYSIMIDCRRCSQSAFVDRKDYDLAEIITCPMPRCTHSWCKQCNQSIEGGSKHSCDGSAELETLMNQRGWKHCPGCRTPIERSMGCNHMTCSTPGCNMHFCYRCGAVVTRGGTRGEIQAAVTSHYRSCALFDVPRER